MKNLLQRVVPALAGIAVLWGCSHTPELSSEESRPLRTRVFDKATVELVFRSLKAVLQEDGFQIKSQESDGSALVAALRQIDNSSQLWGTSAYQPNYRTAVGVEVSAKITAAGPDRVTLELSAQKAEHFSLGGQQGVVIHDPVLYRSWFDRVKNELLVRRTPS